MTNTTGTLTCTRCGRTRKAMYIKLAVLKSAYGTKKRYRCRARSVCSSIARRNRG